MCIQLCVLELALFEIDVHPFFSRPTELGGGGGTGGSYKFQLVRKSEEIP